MSCRSWEKFVEQIKKKIEHLSDAEIIEAAMLEQFAKHHLGGDVDAAIHAVGRVRSDSISPSTDSEDGGK